MYERFTDRARKAMQLAHEEANRLHHQYIGTEAILLGLLKEGNGVAVNVLKSLDYDLDKIRIEVEKAIQSTPKIVSSKKRLPHTPRAKKVVEYAIEETRSLNDSYVGTEHILLGILREPECVAAKVLASNYLTIDKVRREISRLRDRAEREKMDRDDHGRRGMPDIPSFISHILAQIRKGVRFRKSPKGNDATNDHQRASYERFTDRARKVMQFANQEAQRFNHEYIGTEHILLGLVKEGSGVAAHVLKIFDVDLRKVRNEVENMIQPGPDTVNMGKLPHTPQAKKVIEYAIDEARNLNHNYIGTEHLLLGLLHVQEGVAAKVLMNLNLELNKVREVVLNLLGHGMDSDYVRDPESAEEPRKVMKLASGESQRLNHEYIGTEHLLLGIVKQGSGVTAKVFQNHNLDLRTLRKEVERIVSPGPDMVTMGKLPHTPDARKAIEYAIEEARNLKHDHVASEHLLLGLLRDETCVAARVLTNLNIDLKDILKEVLELLDKKGEPPSK